MISYNNNNLKLFKDLLYNKDMSKRPQNQTKTDPPKQSKSLIITEQQKSSNPILNTVYKRIRNLNKKLTNIQQLQKQPIESLKQQQKLKIQRKQQTINEIKKNEQFVLYYKNILQQNNGQIYDPSEILNKVGTLLVVGQFVDRNKGILFKPEISTEFKGLYENVYKNIGQGNQNISLPQRVNVMVGRLVEYTRSEKYYQICKEFMRLDYNEKKEDVSVKVQEKKIQEGKKMQENGQRRTQPKKYTTKASWFENSSDQDEQNQQNITDEMKKQVDVKKPIPQPIKKQEVKVQISLVKPTQTVVNKEIKQEHPLIPQTKQQQPTPQLQVQQPLKKQDQQYQVKKRQPYQQQVKYQQKQKLSYYNKNEQKYQKAQYYPRQGKYHEVNRDQYYPQGGTKKYQQTQKQVPHHYTPKYPSNGNEYKRPSYDEEDYHKPRYIENKRYHTNKYDNHYEVKEHRYNERPQRRRDSDTSLEETPEKLHHEQEKGYNRAKYSGRNYYQDYNNDRKTNYQSDSYITRPQQQQQRKQNQPTKYYQKQRPSRQQ